MALDSYKIRERKTKPDENKSLLEMKNLIESLGDIDQEWIKENESKEFSYSQQAPSNSQEEEIDDMISDLEEAFTRFEGLKNQNNERRKGMRSSKLMSIKELEEFRSEIREAKGKAGYSK